MKAMLKVKAHRGGRGPQRGAVAVIFGLTIALLIGFIGLAIDLGRFFVIKAELQNAMDACALSAASQLRPGAGDVDALDRALAYGRVFTTGGVKGDPPLPQNEAAIQNKVNFQGAVLNLDLLNITFSATNNGTFSSTNNATTANEAKFVKCEYALTDLPILFMRIFNAVYTTQTVSAWAVATRDAPRASCIPVGICKKPGGTTGNNFGYALGEWITVVGDGAYGTGNFGWIDFTPPGGGSSEVEAVLKGSMQCDVSQIGASVGGQGAVASLAAPWNSRFGWYQNSITSPIPDFTGFAYSWDSASGQGNWPSGSNAYSGTSTVPNYKAQTAAFASYQTDEPPGIPSGGYQDPITPAQHQSTGRADRRIATAPVVDCSVWASGNLPGSAQPTIEGFACVLMLNPFDLSGPADAPRRKAKVEYLGLVTDAGSPCTGGVSAITPVLTQ